MKKRIKIIEEKGIVIACLEDSDGYKYYGKAKCHPEDAFDLKIGVEYAYLRAMKRFKKKQEYKAAENYQKAVEELRLAQKNFQKACEDYTQAYEEHKEYRRQLEKKNIHE